MGDNIIEEALRNLLRLSDRTREVASGYFNSAILSESNFLNEKIRADLFDWGLMGAISESPIVVTGATDRGKTDFAKILCTALFGEQEDAWHTTDIDLDFGALTYSTTDFSALDGKTTNELFYTRPWVSFPGLIWNEPNRAPAKLVNKLLHILEKDFTLENGERVLAGHEYTTNDGEKARYQFHLLTMNEGPEYQGTSEVDQALRRRETIEVPIDLFQSTMLDKKMMGEARTGELQIVDGKSNLDKVLQILGALSHIPISTEAEQFRLYVQAMDYCEHSLTKSKRGIHFSESICSKVQEDGATNAGCHYLGTYAHQMCPNVYELTDGVAIKFGTIARAYALMRALKVVQLVASYQEREEAIKNLPKKDFKVKAAQKQVVNGFYAKLRSYLGMSSRKKIANEELASQFVESYIEALKVEPSDLRAVLPFVSYSKQQFNPHWVERDFQGSRWHALKSMSDVAYGNVVAFQTDHRKLFEAVTRGKKLSSPQSRTLGNLYQMDPWLRRSLEAYGEAHSSTPAAKKVLGLLS